MVLVIVKAFDILEFVARDQSRAFSLTEIAEALKLNQATCANILRTLVEKNYLEHVGRKKGYRLGPMAYSLTGNHAYGQTLVEAAKDVMEALTAQLNESSLLGILRNQKRYIVHLVNSDQDLQVRSRTERNVYETATGRLLLAYLSEKEQGAFLAMNGLPAAETWPEASTADGMAETLQKIREEELASTHSKSHIIGLAVPIREGQRVVAALSIFLPVIRFNTQRREEIEQALREAAEAIRQRLGGKE
ncbi:MAG: IclR family transcriptional regulator [Sphingobacteriaceae bacterium]|nr:IclR family transcriptional regulator [Cytophagaceae bacterium]